MRYCAWSQPWLQPSNGNEFCHREVTQNLDIAYHFSVQSYLLFIAGFLMDLQAATAFADLTLRVLFSTCLTFSDFNRRLYLIKEIKLCSSVHTCQIGLFLAVWSSPKWPSFICQENDGTSTGDEKLSSFVSQSQKICEKVWKVSSLDQGFQKDLSPKTKECIFRDIATRIFLWRPKQDVRLKVTHSFVLLCYDSRYKRYTHEGRVYHFEKEGDQWKVVLHWAGFD